MTGKINRREADLKDQIEAFVIKVDAGLCLGKKFTLDFSKGGKQNKKIFDLLENAYKKGSIYVGCINGNRFGFLPPTTGLYATMVGLNRNKLLFSFVGTSRFEILNLDESAFDKSMCIRAKIRLLKDRKIDPREQEEVDYLRNIIDGCVADLLSFNDGWHWIKHIFTEEPGILADEMVASGVIFEEIDVQIIFYTLDPLIRLKIATNRFITFTEYLQLASEEKRGGKQSGAFQKTSDAHRKDNKSYFEDRLKEVKKFMDPDLVKTVDAHLQEYLMDSGTDGKAFSYLDFVLGLPWGKFAIDSEDPVNGTEKQLDQDHYGLMEVKKKILEYMAVRQLNPKNKSSILCLIGPPGVGKTSIAKSLGKALNRPVARISLGGVHDESDIRGFHYTYQGAKAGEIAQILKRLEVMNPVIILDEADKMGERSAQGSPAAALMEALDFEQNDKFKDHFVGGSIDLSQVFFILTGNDLENINPTLLDRLCVIRLDGYSVYEKFEIAKKFLVPKQIKNNGLEGRLFFDDESLMLMIYEYSLEAGVRNLERNIENICRHIALNTIRNLDFEPKRIKRSDVEEILGPPKFELSKCEATEIGCSTGLAISGYVGEIITIETEFRAKNLNSGASSRYTGVTEEVVESVEKAFTILSNLDPAFENKINEIFRSKSVHFNIGSLKGGVDGPSAGIAILCALYSLFFNVPIREKIAFTGALSLKKVCKVAGIAEKAMGASRAGVSELVLPEANKLDFEALDLRIRSQFQKVYFVNTPEEALKIVFGDDYDSILKSRFGKLFSKFIKKFQKRNK